MGVNNRHRRRAKQQRRRRTESVRGFTDRGQPNDAERLDGQAIRGAVLAAAEAFRFESEAAYRSRLDALARVSDRAGPDAVERAIAWWIERGLDRAWESGWQPADVVRGVRRTLTAGHAEAVAAAVAASGGRRPEAAADGRWAAQVAAIVSDAGRASPRPSRSSAVALAVEAVSLLLHLPPLPRLSATTSRGTRAGGGASGAVLERVRALLAKAESTTFPEEAEALSAKAQELMARHAIDAAMLDAKRDDGPADVVGWRIGIDDPYAAAKSLLLDRIAAANRCRAVWSTKLGFSTVFGARADLEVVELLFTSLLVQGTEAMMRAGRSVDHEGRSRTRSFRQSFLLAYATRIGERLAATAAAVVAEGAERHGDALLPVLAGRAEAVDEAVRAAYPGLVDRGMAISNYSGWVAGRAAAELASLAVGEELAAG